MTGRRERAAAYLVRGEDPVLVREATRRLLQELVGDGDAALLVEEVALDDPEAGVVPVVDAAQTPPFLTDRRIVVARDVQALGAERLGPLLGYLADPLPTTTLVLTATGSPGAKLVNAVKAVGAVIDCDPSPKQSAAWVQAQAREAGLRLDAGAAALIVGHLGEDLGRLPEVLRALEAFSAPGTTLRADDVRPFLGEAGGVPPWELTDAIDAGDTSRALACCRRMLAGGGRHPLVVHAVLTAHYGRMLRLEGAGVSDEAEAAAVLGMGAGRSSFPAKKALAQSRRLGLAGIARALELLHEADCDLKGRRDVPAELVMEVLVARLSRLAPAAAPPRPSRRPAPRAPGTGRSRQA